MSWSCWCFGEKKQIPVKNQHLLQERTLLKDQAPFKEQTSFEDPLACVYNPADQLAFPEKVHQSVERLDPSGMLPSDGAPRPRSSMQSSRTCLAIEIPPTSNTRKRYHSGNAPRAGNKALRPVSPLNTTGPVNPQNTPSPVSPLSGVSAEEKGHEGKTRGKYLQSTGSLQAPQGSQSGHLPGAKTLATRPKWRANQEKKSSIWNDPRFERFEQRASASQAANNPTTTRFSGSQHGFRARFNRQRSCSKIILHRR